MRQAGLVNLGWIRTDNLRPLLAELSPLVGYGFDDSDWIAVEHGIRGTDSEAGPWFEYPVGRIGARLALEPGADEMVSVQLDGASKSEQQKIRWLGTSCGTGISVTRAGSERVIQSARSRMAFRSP